MRRLTLVFVLFRIKLDCHGGSV